MAASLLPTALIPPPCSALSTHDSALAASGVSPWQLVALKGSAADGHMDLLTVVLHEIGHVLGFGDQQAVRPTNATLMTETLPDGVRRTLVPESSFVNGHSSIDLTNSTLNTQQSTLSAGHSVLRSQHSALGVSDSAFAISYQQIRSVRPTTEPMATPAVIDWGEEESSSVSAPVSSGGIKMQSSWLSKFLSATGAKQDRATAHDFEVALPKKK